MQCSPLWCSALCSLAAFGLLGHSALFPHLGEATGFAQVLPTVLWPENSLKALSWVSNRVHLICFSSLQYYCPLIPDDPMFWKTGISNILLEGERQYCKRRRRWVASIGKTNVVPLTPSWAKADPLFCVNNTSLKNNSREYINAVCFNLKNSKLIG